MTTNVATTAPPPAAIPGPVKFLFGGLAGMGATLFVQPLDLVKNRMQLSGMAGKREYKSSVHALRSIVAKEGFFALYNGLSAGLARQATYTTTRLGIYSWLFERFSTPGVAGPSFALKAVLGMSAGGVASIVGNPMELALVRMTADGRLPPAERRNYKNVFDALFRVTREEGVLTLWRGCTPTVIRAMVVNAAQLATYSQAKQQLVASFNFKEGIPLHFCASMVSGFATTVASMPVDIVKTRRVIDGKPEFSGVFDVVRRIIGNEGFFALWKGFFPYYFRLGPHTLKMRLRKEERKSASTERAAANTSSSEALKVPKTEPSVEGNDQPTQQQQPPQANLDPNAACYCGAPRVLGGLEVCCDTCKRWFHQSCFRNLENFGGLPFMVSYKFQCQNCSQDGTEKWNIRSTNHSSMTVMALANMTLNYLKKQDEPADVKANPFFDVESEIAEYMEKNWEYLSTGARPKKKNWHLTILKILQKETELFVQDPERPTAFALKERDLFRIGPMHESVVQLFKRGRDAAVEREANALQIGEQQLNSLVEGGGLAEGPKTRGASKRKAAAANVTLTISDRSTESSPKPAGTPSGGAAGAPPAAKKSKTAADFATVQIEGGQATVDFPFNREGYRYYLVERDPNIPNRERFDTEEVNNTRAVQIPGHIYRIVIPSVVTLSPNDRANQLLLDADCLTVMGNEGYSMVRATHPVSHGAWYYEMEFLNQPGDSHVRVGWAQSFSVLQACVGYSKFTYGMRSKHGTAFHDGYGRHYATGGFRQGDVVGCLIELPPLEETSSARCPISEVLPASRKDRDLIKFKQNHFFEEKEEPQQALQKLKPLPNSKIEFFINGKSCGPAFTDIYEGHYFPAVSLFQSARVRMNFGPNFRCAPEKVRSGQVRAMSERPQQMHIEQAVADMLHMVVNEAELEQKNADYFDAILAKDQQQSVQPPATTNNAVQQ